ncbi:MAG: SRPBCC domain-containing protein [Rhodomicrobium sp.]
MTDKAATIQVYRIVIKASAHAIWDAITKPEWTERYAYGGRAEYDLRVDGRFSHKASAEMKSHGLPDETMRLSSARSSRAIRHANLSRHGIRYSTQTQLLSRTLD